MCVFVCVCVCACSINENIDETLVHISPSKVLVLREQL